MKILYVTQYFTPEIGATTNRALANVRCLADKGHRVTVLTEMPNHPKGIIFEGYRKKIFMKEKIENFSANRVWIHTTPKKNFITRISFYLSFVFMGILHSIFNWKKYDVVYVTSPPLFTGIIGLFLKMIHPKSKFIFEVRDLWPDAAIEMGELTNRIMIKFSYKLENSLYRNADHIVAVTKSFKQEIIKKGFAENKISVIRNGSDLSFKNVKVSEKLRMQFNKANNFIVIYAGNLGIAQNLITLLKAAEKLLNDNILFILIGTGVEESLLKKYAKEHNLNNVEFTGEIPKKDVSQFMSLADFGIIPLKNINVFRRTIPSKLFDYMSANLPVLLGVKGEAEEILDESKAGISFEPDNVDDLVEKINKVMNNRSIVNIYKQNGRKFVEDNFDRRKQASVLEGIIQNVVNNKEF